MHPLVDLAVGRVESGISDGLGEVLRVVGGIMDRCLSRLRDLRPLNEDNKRELAAFYARRLLETVCTILIARIDPFRVLALRQVQIAPGFRIDARTKCAIDWAKDVVGDTSRPWSQDLTAEQLERSLFCSGFGDVFWQPAHSSLSDDLEVKALTASAWLSELIAISPGSFSERVRGQFRSLYSVFSKGVHQEFVIAVGAPYDEPTVTDKVDEAIKVCAWVSLVSHKLSGGICQMPMKDALGLFVLVERGVWDE